MRIQHNIMAMNSYRNYNNNVNSLSKNLEKLSSGYRINRAGDDAAGLAISEKMRAQITGLDAAQKNVKDGISLVKTAEGAMQEIQDMMNRMKYLAVQSANGTYDNEVDRANLQKEVDALKTEINRIADSANFNGQKLLDGSLGGGNIAGDLAVASTKVVTAATTSVDFATANDAQAAGDTLNYTVAWSEGGVEKSKTVSFKVGDTTTELYVLDADGNKTDTKYTVTATATKTELQSAVIGELKKDSALSSAFDIAADGDGIKFTSKVAGADGAKITALGATGNISTAALGGGISTTAGDVVEGKDSMQKLDLSKLDVIAGTTEKEAKDIEDATFEVLGQKFMLVGSNATATTLKNVPEDVHMIKLNGTTYTAANDAQKVADELTRITGQKFEKAAAADTNADITANDIIYKGDEELVSGGKGMTLQIGDTAHDYNQLNVTVSDMHVEALGIGDLDISALAGAQKAVDDITTAINRVSSTRGDLGAVQNRLEHTANNLAVMEENITDAESTIRDTDVADEMMAYTKNNILIQSAQAMLAQANAVPQGVLQLLG